MRTRRELLTGLAALTGATAATSALWSPRALAGAAADPRFLIVLCATGGGSVIDGPLAIRASESANADRVNTFPDALVTGWDDSPFRAVDMAGPALGPIPSPFAVAPSRFLGTLREHLMVATWTRTSVNHGIGQRRSVTGNEAWRGRTLQEAVAWQYGADAPLPNVHLLGGTGFTEPGTDPLLPSWARGQLVADPHTWPLSLDGTRGLADGVDARVLAELRAHRERFEAGTAFQRAFTGAPRLEDWRALRGEPQARVEAADLITRLMLREDAADFPLGAHGLSGSPAGAAVRAAFPRYAFDPLHAQAALAFLLLKYRVSVSVTLGPTVGMVVDPALAPGDEGRVINPPTAFDRSHQGHRSCQAVVWEQLYAVMDGLIRLLAAEDFGDGTSLWDRTLLYVASDFGRDPFRPPGASEWNTGHHPNNGVLVCSPLVPGDTLRGGVDPDTGLTWGFDPRTGAPDPGRTMTEPEIFAGLLGALGVDTSGSGLPDVPAMRR